MSLRSALGQSSRGISWLTTQNAVGLIRAAQRRFSLGPVQERSWQVTPIIMSAFRPLV